jgi:hypothetical protein
MINDNFSKTRVKCINLNTCKLICHDKAVGAWRTYQAIIKYSKQYIQSGKLEQVIIDSHPISVIKKENGKFHFFSGFLSPVFYDGVYPEYVNVIIYNNISQDAIRQISWAYLLSILSLRIHSKFGLANAYLAINKYLPEELCYGFFNSNHLSKKTLSEYLSVSESSINKQLESLDSYRSSKTMFDKILENK